MLFDNTHVEITHEENMKCIHWFIGTLKHKGHTPKEIQLAGYMLSSYFQAMPVFQDILDGTVKPKCEACEGTGKSKLFIAGSNPQCNDCGGTGIKTLEIKEGSS